MSVFARSLHVAAAAIAAVLLSAQAPAAQDETAQYETMCANVLKERTDLVPQCRDEQQLAHHFTLSWLEQYGFLADDGSIDTLKILAGQTDAMGLTETPAAAAAFCLENGDNWIGISECLTALDSNSLFGLGNPAGAIGEPFVDGAHAEPALPSGN